MNILKNKNFALEKVADGFVVMWDDKIFKTPAGHDFVVPTDALGDVIINEWRVQKDKINPATMPMNQLAATALDIISKERTEIINQLCAYATTELLCHRAAEPPALTQRQDEIWQPLLDWCALQFNAPLTTTNGIMPVEQPAASLIALRLHIEGLDNYNLAGLRHAVDVSGSLVLGLALSHKKLTADKALDASELDNIFQAEKWGSDPASETRHAKNLLELQNCELWFKLGHFPIRYS